MYYGYGYGFNHKGDGVIPFDADAQAFITAASITDPTQQSAVNQLVVDLKSANVWTDIDVAFPFVGGNATAHRYDLKSATTFGTFYGGVTHNSDGVTFNGTTGVMWSGWDTTVANLYDRHYSKYMKTMSGSNFDGRYDGTNVFGGSYSGATTLIQVGCNNLPASFSQAISANAVTCINVESNTVGKVYNDGNLVHTTAAAINASPNSGMMFIGALNNAGSGAGIFHNTNVAFATYGKALNSTKQAALNTAVKTFNTTLGR